MRRRTSAEQKMADLLDELGVPYEEQVKVDGHRVDFLVGRVIVEANGDWWHRTEMWKSTDEKKLRKWKDAGRVVVGVWESRLDKEPEKVKEAIMVALTIGKEPEFWDWAVERP